MILILEEMVDKDYFLVYKFFNYDGFLVFYEMVDVYLKVYCMMIKVYCGI